MRARAIREGSVGLLILMAVGLFGGLVLWLRGFSPRSRIYNATLVFENTLGIQAGAAVRYRGVQVGRVLSVRPTTNAVDVAVEISSSDLRIGRDASILINQSGLIGETTIDITPLRPLTPQELAVNPNATDCPGQAIICNGDRLSGSIGASYESLIRSAEGLASAFADPEIIADLKTTLNNAVALTESVNLLSGELMVISQQLQQDLPPLLTSATRATDNVGNAAAEFELTGAQVNQLVVANRGTIANTLDSINRSAAHIETVTATLGPALQNSDFLTNLNQLSADAALAAADVRSITTTFNSPANLVALQQTLDSARTVFQSAHKVLADVDELTGDPTLRRSIRDLINGLSTLVSQSEQLHQAGQVAVALTPPAGTPLPPVTLTPLPQGHAADPLVVTYQGQSYRVNVPAASGGRSPSLP